MAGTAGFAFAAAKATAVTICHRHIVKSRLSNPWDSKPHKWQGRLDSNQRMSASKADALPLGDAPIFVIRNSFTLKITRCVCSASQGYMGWVKGLEPSTLGTTIRCSNQLSYTHHIHVMTAKQYLLSEPNGRDGWIRTSECRRQRPMPYRLATPPYSRCERGDSP